MGPARLRNKEQRGIKECSPLVTLFRVFEGHLSIRRSLRSIYGGGGAEAKVKHPGSTLGHKINSRLNPASLKLCFSEHIVPATRISPNFTWNNSPSSKSEQRFPLKTKQSKTFHWKQSLQNSTWLQTKMRKTLSSFHPSCLQRYQLHVSTLLQRFIPPYCFVVRNVKSSVEGFCQCP